MVCELSRFQQGWMLTTDGSLRRAYPGTDPDGGASSVDPGELDALPYGAEVRRGGLEQFDDGEERGSAFAQGCRERGWEDRDWGVVSPGSLLSREICSRIS